MRETVVSWLSKALVVVPEKVRHNQQPTHVEAETEGSQDGGSIPPASIRAG